MDTAAELDAKIAKMMQKEKNLVSAWLDAVDGCEGADEGETYGHGDMRPHRDQLQRKLDDVGRQLTALQQKRAALTSQ
jgi:hypothetical protein